MTARLSGKPVLTFSLHNPAADLHARSIEPLADGIRFDMVDQGHTHTVRLKVPGDHNIANALAAIAAVKALGLNVAAVAKALESFEGIRRRLETVGTKNSITVIDDFAHNPDKISATLNTLHSYDGRLVIMFQPHGFGPLKLMKAEFIDTFASLMKDGDILLMPQPVYYGGTTDRSITSEHIAEGVRQRGQAAEALETREDCGNRILELARSGDRILVMGARDDTLSVFARDILDRI